MKLSLVFELLLIFILLAFAASKSVGNPKNKKKFQIQNKQDLGIQDDNSLNKYCKCSEAYCDCCRDFSVPLVNLDGPGCAKLTYLDGNKMAVSLSFGKKVITNKVLASRKPSPVCMPLPGGISKFCGRVYNIGRTGEEFRACLGLELQAKKTVEAAVRVSCFKFGPRGVSMEPADPLPLVPQGEKNDDDEDDDDDDDDDDEFGLGDDDDAEFDGINDVDSADYTGFSILGEDLLGDLFGGAGSSGSSSGTKKSNKNKKKQAPSSLTTTTTTTRRPRPTRRTTRRPSPVTVRPIRSTTVRVRPVSRRTRRPSRRPGSRKPISSTTELTTRSSIVTSTQASTLPISSISPVLPSTERINYISTAQEETFEPVVIVTQRPTSALPSTTQKPADNFADPGIEMSLAHITGQLSAIPAPAIINDPKESGLPSSEEQINFEKIQTITPKSTTVSFQKYDDSVRIVSSLDSEEHVTEMEPMVAEESRAHYEGLLVPRQNANGFGMEDLDVLDLESIGESVGDQFGLFERNKKKNKNKPTKPQKNKKKDDGVDYDVLGLEQIGEVVGDSIGVFGRSNKNGNRPIKLLSDREKEEENLLDGIDTMVGDAFNFDRSDKNNKRNRRRQNKMMKEWSQN